MAKESNRLDVVLSKSYPNLTRSVIQKLIKNGYVFVNKEVTTKPNSIIKGNPEIEIKTDVLKKDAPTIKLEVLHEDENCVAVNKPEGLLTHSKGAFNPEPTVLSWLKSRQGYDFNKDNDRGGIVHRLDRGTSGVILCAKNIKTLGMLQKQFQNRTTKKKYIAVVQGVLEPSHAIIDLPIERNPKKPQLFRVDPKGKSALTEYQVVEKTKKKSLVELRPTTGRTHQLRVHLNYIKHPIIGDIFYEGEVADRLYLHAESLEITLPGSKRTIITAPIPESFGVILND